MGICKRRRRGYRNNGKRENGINKRIKEKKNKRNIANDKFDRGRKVSDSEWKKISIYGNGAVRSE